MRKFVGSKTLTAGSAEFTVPTGNVITYMVPEGTLARIQCLAHSGSGNDKALDGVYTPATDANASTLPGPTWGKYKKAKVPTTSESAVEIFWEEE